ncbi:cell adhesion molecule Dscam2-like isoform X4 [Oratosquilla oratoria]|uniref:cell adhesion molecule Dscam2-like isoform X4 n=1 Tax=Oratosquilla oratoria TaxID=337810 RepID=UPI003F77427A
MTILSSSSSADSAPVIEYRFISQTLQPGPSVSLKCIASGAPTPHLTWALDGFPLPQSDRLVVGQYVGVGGAVVSHVNISNVRAEDGGSYSCKAESRAGTASHSARLNVYGPAYVRPMSVVTAVAGEALVLHCPASGFPLASITWSRDGRTLPVNLRQNVHDNGTLVVSNVQKKIDSGSYTCTAKDKQGQQHSATASVQVLVPPKLSPFTFRDDLALGERVSVQCTVNRGDTPLSIGWSKDQVSAEHLSGVQVRQYDQYSAVLTIAHLSPAHAGNYSCTARNDAASVEHTAPLNVNVPPSWVVEPRDVGVVLGQAVTVPCQARGFPTPKISWRRGRADRPGEYSPLLEGMGVGMGVGGAEVASNGSLVLRWARSEDEGQYLCEATNGVGGGLSALVRLTVNAPPVLDKSGESRVSVRRGGSVTLECEARGDTPISLLWTKDDRSVPQANSLVEEMAGGVRGKLLLTSVETEGAGPYTCKASNTYGQDTFTIMLVVQDVPGPPHGLRVSETGSRSLVVSWLPPRSHHSPVDSYIVSYKVAQEFQHRVWSSGEGEVLVEGHSTSARLAPLVPATLYHVRVSAANSLGQSQPSEPLQVNTDGEAPSGPPRDVEIVESSPTTIEVRWKAPASESIHGSLQGYHVGYRKHNVGTEGSFNFTTVGMSLAGTNSVGVVGVGGGSGGVSGSHSSGGGGSGAPVVGTSGSSSLTGGRVQLAGLHAWTQYAIVVQAFNSHGSGPLSPALLVRTAEDKPSSPPQAVKCSGGNVGSLQIQWGPPPPDAMNGPLQGYRLTLLRFQDDTASPTDDVEEITRMTTARQETVTGLRRFTNYTVTVAAFTGAGTGVASRDLVCTTKEDVPGAPGGIRALQSGPDSAVISWLPPRYPNGILLDYTLHHRPAHGHTEKKTLDAHRLTYTFRQLARGTHEFWLTARTRLGEGAPTLPVKLTLVDQASAGLASWGGRIVKQRGESVRLECVAVGISSPSTIWRRRGRQLYTRDRHSLEQDGSLQIRDLEREDQDNYTCSLDSSSSPVTAAYASITYSLHVQVPPSPPSVHVDSPTPTGLTVSWESGDNGGAAVTAWAVWWRPADKAGATWNTKTVGRSVNSLTLTGLECGAKYQVYVTAYTHVGESDPSNLIMTRTAGSAPLPPPPHQVASTNSSSVAVWLGRWQDGGCAITHFTLEYRASHDNHWTTLASSLAPQEVYEVGGLREGERYSLRLTGHNAAGAATTTVVATTGQTGGSATAVAGAEPSGEYIEGPSNSQVPMYKDPRMLASATASILALCLTIATIVLCIRRRAASGGNDGMTSEEREAEENKTNLLHQRDTYYATVRKPQPVPATLERIPEYSEDIYPYATFQLGAGGEGRGSHDDSSTVSTKFQKFVYNDPRYGVTEARPVSSPQSSRSIYGKSQQQQQQQQSQQSSGHSRSRSRGRAGPRSESEEYDSLQSDSDTEHATSSRTESSIHLDSAATLENPNTHHLPLDPHLATLEGGAPERQGGRSRNVIHNLIYHAPESSTSTEPSPVTERKSFPRKCSVTKMGDVRLGIFGPRGSKTATLSSSAGAGGASSGRTGYGTQETSLTYLKKVTAQNKSKASLITFPKQLDPPTGFSDSRNELSEAECDLESRMRRKSDPRDPDGTSRLNFIHFPDRRNKDYSIKV